MASGYRSVAYFVNWAIYARNHLPQTLPADKLTHVLYAFGNVRQESGEVFLTDPWADTDIHWEGDSWNDTGTNLYGCLKQLNLLKKKNRNLKIMLSIGGWSYSSNFHAPAATPESRVTFAKSALELVKNLGFDGIDIDWEYPQDASEAASYVALLRECRKVLDEYGNSKTPAYHFELSVACPAGAQNYEKLDIAGMDKYLDFWNLMAYDYAGSWSAASGHQANLLLDHKTPASTVLSTAGSVHFYTTHGVATNKVVLGMPLYGRAFENTDGIGKPFNGVGEGNWEKGVYDYKKLPLPGSTEHLDNDVGASYCYNPATKVLVSYDTCDMARKKATFIKEKCLGGAMWWESSADKEGPESIIAGVVDALGGPSSLLQKQNCIEYPDTKYQNFKEGFPSF